MTSEERDAVDRLLFHPDGPRYGDAADLVGTSWPCLAAVLRRFAGFEYAKNTTLRNLLKENDALRDRVVDLERRLRK